MMNFHLHSDCSKCYEFLNTHFKRLFHGDERLGWNVEEE